MPRPTLVFFAIICLIFLALVDARPARNSPTIKPGEMFLGDEPPEDFQAGSKPDPNAGKRRMIRTVTHERLITHPDGREERILISRTTNEGEDADAPLMLDEELAARTPDSITRTEL